MFCLQQFVVLFKEGGGIVGGIVGADKNLAGFDIQGNHAAALCVITVYAFLLGLQSLNDRGQLGLSNHLQGTVNGDFHVGAGFRLCQIPGGDQCAVGCDGIFSPAVGAVKILLISFFQTALSNHGIHFIAGQILIILPLIFVHGTYMAQNMGSIGSVVFADGGGFHGQTRNAHFCDDGDGLIVCVTDKNKVGQGGDTVPKTHFIAQANDFSCFVICPLLWNLINLPQFFYQQRCRNIRVQTTLVIQKHLEISAPGGTVIVQYIYKRLFRRDGEMICIGDPVLIAGFDQPVEMVVGAICRQQNIMVQH